ncbi:ArsA family ATPase [Persicimonas caeni]|uniref:ArsA family ATPase n=1 Tax=Persicimonas caeni TaxID=2292766 RepID=A0A4Y6Q0N6_PERCE|nr:ArsA-related P-loop ATPase [Persicimonas caeni]QDG54050.1 ArsA family ATPase [Persicimonas caeni]QED35271.1 ArsA family ATPase [Persicimonas caeni]
MSETPATRQTDHDPVSSCLETARLIVCSGPGGVGKTTTAAALGLRGALMGRKVIVLTIDPAKRLANSLGLAELTNTPQHIPLEEHLDELPDPGEGELWAMMLDQEQTLAELVARHAPDTGALERAKENNIYKLLSTALAGMQEYMALEKLHDLYTGGYFDLVVLDTPPTKNALDFLETPKRASRFFDERIIKWFLPDKSKSGGFFSRVFNAGSVVQGLLSKIFGENFITDLVEFFDTFQYLIDVLKERGDMIEFILRDPATYFLIITSADPRRIKEALYFHEKLAKLDQKAQAFIINRVTPEFQQVDVERVQDAEIDQLLREHGLEDADEVARMRDELEAHYRSLAKLAVKDRTSIETLGEKVGRHVLQSIPLLGEDVHTLGALLKLSNWLTPSRPVTA